MAKFAVRSRGEFIGLVEAPSYSKAFVLGEEKFFAEISDAILIAEVEISIAQRLIQQDLEVSL